MSRSLGEYTILDHTADVGVLATGRDLASALSRAARGMFSVITALDLVEPRRALRVSVASADRETLVVDWLNELLYVHEAEGLLLSDFRVSVDRAGKSLEAECRGEAVDLDRHRMRLSVKAATYHDLEVWGNGEWRIRVVLDV